LSKKHGHDHVKYIGQWGDIVFGVSLSIFVSFSIWFSPEVKKKNDRLLFAFWAMAQMETNNWISKHVPFQPLRLFHLPDLSPYTPPNAKTILPDDFQNSVGYDEHFTGYFSSSADHVTRRENRGTHFEH
jgi:hypothetical protein